MVKDLALKKVIIECKLDAKLRSLSRNIYKEYGKEERNMANMQIAYDQYDEFVELCGNEVIRVCKNLNRAFYKRRKKVKRRIEYMVTTGNCIFLTFTFTDDTLNSTTSDYRRKRVVKFCEKYNCLYVGNIDFGVKDEYIDKLGVSHQGTHREHYHVVIQCDEVDYSDWLKDNRCNDKVKLGTINGIKVRKVEDAQAIATYITKLSNHAIKSSTISSEDYLRSRVIYSKLWKSSQV